MKLPNALLSCSPCFPDKISSMAPAAPNTTPPAFFKVIGSRRMKNASTMTKRGVLVTRMDASSGDVMSNPAMKKPWLNARPHIPQMKSRKRSLEGTFSLGTKRRLSPPYEPE